MAWQHSIQTAVRELRKEETSLQRQLSEVQARIRDLQGLQRSGGNSVARRKVGSRRLSAKGREAISRAAKKRWAKYRRQQATANG
jgi:hypothetical protein